MHAVCLAKKQKLCNLTLGLTSHSVTRNAVMNVILKLRFLPSTVIHHSQGKKSVKTYL